MRASPSSPVSLFAPSRIAHLVRALLVAMLALVLTSVVLTTPNAPGAAAGPPAGTRAA